MSDDYEHIRWLLQEALWCINWALVFSITGVVVFVVAAVEAFRSNDRAFLLMVLGWIVLLFSRHLSAKAHQYHRKAAEVVNGRH